MRHRATSPRAALRNLTTADVTRVGCHIRSRSAIHDLPTTVRFLSHQASTCLRPEPFAPSTTSPSCQPKTDMTQRNSFSAS